MLVEAQRHLGYISEKLEATWTKQLYIGLFLLPTFISDGLHILKIRYKENSKDIG